MCSISCCAATSCASMAAISAITTMNMISVNSMLLSQSLARQREHDIKLHNS